MNTINLKLYDTIRKELNLSEEKSRALTQAIEETVLEELNHNKSEAATNTFVKEEIQSVRNDIHKLELQTYKAIFWAGLIQVLTILSGLIAIIKFMIDK